jgi:uncharacterized protein YndB with AHSA1/START domain
VVELACEAEIRCPAETIFDLIVDFRGQDRWLSKSAAYRGTEEISPGPVTIGTTYREPGPMGVRHGTVVELERPTTLAVHQPMTMRFGLGTMDIVSRYTLSPRGDSTHVRRTVTLDLPLALRLVKPAVLPQIRHESRRTLNAIKAFAEQLR